MAEFEDIEIWADKAKPAPKKSTSTEPTKKEKNNKSLLFGFVALLAFGAAAFAIFALTRDNSETEAASDSQADTARSETDQDSGSDNSGEKDPQSPEAAQSTADLPALLSDGRDFPDSAELQSQVNTGTSAWVVAHQENIRFKLSGEVPDQATKDALEKSMKQTWGPELAVSEITVNESLEGGAWAEDFSFYMKSLVTMMQDTSISINNDTMILDGEAPNTRYAKSFKASAAKYDSLPALTDNLEVKQLEDALIDIQVKDGKATIAGYVATQDFVEVLEYFLIQQYGQENVESTMTVNENSIRSFLIPRFNQNIEAFAPFPEHALKVAYSEEADQRQFTGSVTSGLGFESNSDTLSPEIQGKLDGFIGLMNRTGRPLRLIGHTDSKGTSEDNLELSLKRAENTKAALVAKGIDPDKISTEGKGEEEPLIANQSSDNDRRVEIIFGK